MLCVELLVAATAPSFMESQPLIYETKLAALDAGTLRGEVIVLGDSTAVAAFRPDALEPALPEGWRLSNLALPGSGPVVGEYLLRRILAAGSGEPPPRLVVLSFSTLSFTQWRPNFVEYPLTHLLPLGPVLRAAWAERDLGYLLEWIATRMPSLRHREELKSGALSLLFDRWPRLAERFRALTRDTTHDALFRWRYTKRAERNRQLAQELLRQRGWHLFDEMRLPEGELDAQVRYDQGAFYFPAFVATPREERALERLLDLCEAHSIPGARAALGAAPSAHASPRSGRRRRAPRRVRAAGLWRPTRRRGSARPAHAVAPPPVRGPRPRDAGRDGALHTGDISGPARGRRARRTADVPGRSAQASCILWPR